VTDRDGRVINTATTQTTLQEFRGCVKVEMAVLGPMSKNMPYGFRGREATLNLNLCHTELRSCVKVEVAVPSPPSLIILMVAMDAKQQ